MKERRQRTTMENEATKQVFDCIDRHQSFIYMSGAGSGKTTSLIASIDHVLRRQNALIAPQQILAITFTNVAADRIKKDIGETSSVHCSTIHDALWSFIKRYKEDIARAFAEVVKEDIKAQQETIDSLPAYSSWDTVIVDSFDEYRNHRFEKAFEFKTFLSETTGKMPSNAGDCQKRLNALWKKTAEEKFLEKLAADPGTIVEYTPKFNQDVLYQGKFSHDTLLIIAKKVLSSGHIALQAFADCYPFIFVDEYQDTADSVIDILVEAANVNPKKDRPLIGFFGDPAQHIYEKVSSDLLNKPFQEKPIVITNPDCYRCPASVLIIANKIRDDQVSQISKFPAKVSFNDIKIFTSGKDANYKTFVTSVAKEDPEKKWGCFLLRNSDIADALSFSTLFSVMNSSPHFRRYYNEIKDEFLASDETKLSPAVLVLKRITKFYSLLTSDDTHISTLLPPVFLQRMSFSEAKKCLAEWGPFPSVDDSFGSLLDFFENKREKSAEFSKSLLINCPMPDGDFSKKAFIELLVDGLSSEDGTFSEGSLENVKIGELLRWLSYLDACQTGKIVYRTFHGTKGDEYENVIIILDARLGTKGAFFHQFFKDGSDKIAQNLLYVAITRTKGSIRLLYRDDCFAQIKEGFCSIFGTSYVAI